ncbi:hypothetical protein ASD64_13755 [Mesorhizobium sp. Root157]|nr:hypothetical protein ASD64_13755 [Mesorhizobium sp. Root157]
MRIASRFDIARHRAQPMQQSVEHTPSCRVLLAQYGTSACSEAACRISLSCGSEGLKARAQDLAKPIRY